MKTPTPKPACPKAPYFDLKVIAALVFMVMVFGVVILAAAFVFGDWLIGLVQGEIT